jgi:hypothetical protein
MKFLVALLVIVGLGLFTGTSVEAQGTTLDVEISNSSTDIGEIVVSPQGCGLVLNGTYELVDNEPFSVSGFTYDQVNDTIDQIVGPFNASETSGADAMSPSTFNFSATFPNNSFNPPVNGYWFPQRQANTSENDMMAPEAIGTQVASGNTTGLCVVSDTWLSLRADADPGSPEIFRVNAGIELPIEQMVAIDANRDALQVRYANSRAYVTRSQNLTVRNCRGEMSPQDADEYYGNNGSSNTSNPGDFSSYTSYNPAQGSSFTCPTELCAVIWDDRSPNPQGADGWDTFTSSFTMPITVTGYNGPTSTVFAYNGVSASAEPQLRAVMQQQFGSN